MLVLYNVQEPLHVESNRLNSKGQSLSRYIGKIRANPRFEQVKSNILGTREAFFFSEIISQRSDSWVEAV